MPACLLRVASVATSRWWHAKGRKKGVARGERRRTEHGGVDAREIWKRVVEREDLGWADKGKVTASYKI